MTRDEIVALIVAKARANDEEPWEVLGGAIAESALDPEAEQHGVWPDSSIGLFQEGLKWSDDGNRTNTPNNWAVMRRLYVDDPAHACDVAIKKFTYWRHNPDVPPLTAWVAYNSPGFYKHPEDSPNIENYRQGLLEAMAILEAPAVAYDPNAPVRQQDHDWDCFEESANWGLHALGRNPSDAWLEQQMLADGVESTANGLEDGSGAQAARWITSEYSDPAEGTPTLTASNAASVSFDDVRSVAGMTAVLIGGHHWGSAGHWSGVRGYDTTNDILLLANPADGYGGVHQTMSRQQFAQVGPFSMVVIRADGVPVPPPPAPPDPTNALRAHLTTIRDEAAAALSLLGG